MKEGCKGSYWSALQSWDLGRGGLVLMGGDMRKKPQIRERKRRRICHWNSIVRDNNQHDEKNGRATADDNKKG